VALLLPRGGVQGGGAVPGGESVAVAEPADVADVGEQPGRAGGADAGQVHQGGAAGGHELGEVLLRGFDLLVDSGEFADELDRQPAAGLADQVTWLDRGDQPAGLGSG
jgi:hypothetical protein